MNKNQNNAEATGKIFSKENYIWMLSGLVFLIIGFILMSGGKSADPSVFKEEEIYSTARITIAPILVLIGIALQGFAIMKKPK